MICNGNSELYSDNIQSISDWPINTQSRVLQADWLILVINEKATLNINPSYYVVEETKFDTSELVTSFYILLCSFIPVIKSTPGFLLKSQWGKLICLLECRHVT